jgi:two-component system OmpR family sensor kinase
MPTTMATTVATTTTEAATPGAAAPSESGERPRRRSARFSSVRTRIVATYVGLLALVTLASVVVAREVVLMRLDERINEHLVQETQELRRLAAGVDPATGRPFGDRVRRIFRVYLERNIPVEGEVFLTFVDGEPFLRSRAAYTSYRIDRDRELVNRWGNLETPDRGRVETPAGRLEFLAIPLHAGEQVRGVFVVAQFRDPERRELESAVLAIAAVGAAMLLVGSILAWRLAGRLLRPVKAVTRTARSISETDLSRRISVEGHDEIAELAATFNSMLDRLERGFETQRRFIQDAGHELRTPITIIRGHLELMGEDPEERRQTLELVTDELDRMGRIVNELLDLAKAEEPDFLAVEPIELNTFMTEVHAKASALAPAEWRLESRDAGVFRGDRQRLTQALIQLSQNAVQHAGDAGPIALGAERRNGAVALWVRDQGPGIAREDQQRLFQRFARGSGGRRSEGAGLGLSIVKAIAEAHGGRVEVYSQPGAGTTVTVVVPADGDGRGRATTR